MPKMWRVDYTQVERVNSSSRRSNKMTQRAMMLLLYRAACGAKELCIMWYEMAEQAGEVSRASNTLHLSARDYAARLYADGIRKGWLMI